MRRLVAFSTLVLVLAACEARLEMSVRNDGSGRMGITFLADQKALEAMKAFGGDPFEEMRKDLANDPVGWKISNVNEAGGSGIVATFAFADVADLKSKLDALNAEDGDDPFVDGQLILERSGSGWRFQAKANAPTASDLAPVPQAPGGVTVPGLEQPNPLTGLDSVFGTIRFVFRVTLPGKAGNTNAKKVTSTSEGTRFEWSYTAKDAQPDGAEQLVAYTTAAAMGSSGGSGAGGSGSFPALPVGIATVLAGGVATLLIRRRPPAPSAPVMEGFPVPSLPVLPPVAELVEPSVRD
jgi:hypothetical protein